MQSVSRVDGIPELAPIRLPATERVFVRRAERFRLLVQGSALGDYLAAMASLADAQHAAHDEISIGSKGVLPGEYPLDAVVLHRDDSWRLVLSLLISKMGSSPLPAAARAAMDRLSAAAATELEAHADALLSGDFARMDPSSAPFLGAALQVYWAAIAGRTRLGGQSRVGNKCPVCSSPPVAGIVHGDSRLRYLVCGLCSTEWYLPRLTCSGCLSTEGISYMAIENDASGTKAECCTQCHTYLKLFYLESTPAAEPFADDVATLILDTLVAEEGFSRVGPNFYLLPGA